MSVIDAVCGRITLSRCDSCFNSLKELHQELHDRAATSCIARCVSSGAKPGLTSIERARSTTHPYSQSMRPFYTFPSKHEAPSVEHRLIRFPNSTVQKIFSIRHSRRRRWQLFAFPLDSPLPCPSLPCPSIHNTFIALTND